MYRKPQAQICINGTLTEKFDLFRGCQDRYPLSPFLFNLAVEPLAEAIRANGEIAGINIRARIHEDFYLSIRSTPKLELKVFM